MTKFKAGDIFAIGLPNEQFLFGRILLDVKQQCTKKKLLPEDSALKFFSGSILVEIYEDLSADKNYKESKVLIPGVFIRTDLIKDKSWSIINYKKVEPTSVDFPESLTSAEKGSLFIKGEIKIPLSLTESDLRNLNVYSTVKSPYMLPNICLYYLNLKHLIDPEYAETSHLENSDLRFSKYRSKIYDMIGEDENQSYYYMALKFGYDLNRFYQ